VSDDPLTEEVTALSLNHPSVVNPANGSVLIRSSNYTYLDGNLNEQLDANESVQSYPIVVEESVVNEMVVTVRYCGWFDAERPSFSTDDANVMTDESPAAATEYDQRSIDEQIQSAKFTTPRKRLDR
jgi:hypothetical protein